MVAPICIMKQEFKSKRKNCIWLFHDIKGSFILNMYCSVNYDRLKSIYNRNGT